MGLNAYLTVIARGEYRKYPRASPVALAEFDLNKGWVPLELALRTMPSPLDLALRGDRPTAEEFEDEWEVYEAFVTPALARRVHTALAGVTDEELVAALKSVGFARRKREQPEYLRFFECLKVAYREAVKRDAYLRIFIC